MKSSTRNTAESNSFRIVELQKIKTEYKKGEIAAEYIKNHPEVDKNGDGKIQYVLLEGESNHQDSLIRTESSVFFHAGRLSKKGKYDML